MINELEKMLQKENTMEISLHLLCLKVVKVYLVIQGDVIGQIALMQEGKKTCKKCKVLTETIQMDSPKLQNGRT